MSSLVTFCVIQQNKGIRHYSPYAEYWRGRHRSEMMLIKVFKFFCLKPLLKLTLISGCGVWHCKLNCVLGKKITCFFLKYVTQRKHSDTGDNKYISSCLIVSRKRIASCSMGNINKTANKTLLVRQVQSHRNKETKKIKLILCISHNGEPMVTNLMKRLFPNR